MHKFLRMMLSSLLMVGLCAPLAMPLLLAQTAVPKTPDPKIPVPQIVKTSLVRTIKVLGGKDAVEIEVEASDRIVPQAHILTGPDRLVVDFPNAIPSDQLRSQSVDQGEVKDLQVRLLQSKPPVTRVVLDLKTAQSYQIFPYGRTVIIKVTGSGAEASAQSNTPVLVPVAQPALVAANFTTRAEPVKADTSDQPLLEVTFRDGLLGIRADKVTLAEVLIAVQQRTGAEVLIAAGAEQEKVVADIAPAPAPEVLARLLNGSKFNFLLLSATDDPHRLERVILTPRPAGEFVPQPVPAHVQDRVQDGVQDRVQDDDPEETEPASANLRPGNRVPSSAPVPAQPDGKTPPDENTHDQ
jgi:hypothetical protein